jgi:rhodanese-related sulfurtransferase
LPGTIDRDEVRRLVEREGAQLAEVLPASEYREFHLPGAIHLPLRKVETDARSTLDPTRPVIVYCWDSA